MNIDPGRVDELLTGSYGLHGGKAKGWATLRFSAHRAPWVASEA
ncbi:MAG: hypothetical protein ACOVPA_16310 [Rubrivivax sp.]